LFVESVINISVEYVKKSKGKDLVAHSGYVFEKDYTKKKKKLFGNV